MWKETVMMSEKLHMHLNIMNAIWKRSFKFSKFTAKESKRER